MPKKAGAFASLRKLHHKLMVIDELIVVAGSYNYTEPANLYNDENIFVMGSTHEEVSGVEVEVSPTRKLGRLFRAEIERIISLSEPYDPAAESSAREDSVKPPSGASVSVRRFRIVDST